MRNDHTVTLTLTVYLENSDGMKGWVMYNDIVTKESEGGRVGRVFLWVEWMGRVNWLTG